MLLLAIIGLIAALLTVAMFLSRESMLGFACAIFWALFGGQSYTLSTATWDMYFNMAFASLLGMVTFTAFGAYGLREKRDSYGEQEIEGKRTKTDDEASAIERDLMDGDETNTVQESSRTLALRKRAEQRRTGHFIRKMPWEKR